MFLPEGQREEGGGGLASHCLFDHANRCLPREFYYLRKKRIKDPWWLDPDMSPAPDLVLQLHLFRLIRLRLVTGLCSALPLPECFRVTHRASLCAVLV